MNKTVFLFAVLSFTIASPSTQAIASEKSARLRFFMTEIHAYYRAIQAGIKNGDFDKAKKSANRAYRFFGEIPGLMPKTNKDGTPLNREIFLKSINTSMKTIAQLKEALTQKDVKRSEELLGDIFKKCAKCHNNILKTSKASQSP